MDTQTQLLEPDELLTAAKVAELSGLSYRMLDYHVRVTGLLSPTVPSVGSGTRRLFSQTDLVRARFVARLVSLGAKAPAIERALRSLPADPADWPSYLFISHDGALTDMHPPWAAWWGVSVYRLQHPESARELIAAA